jgi:hypothetical protein
LTEGAEEVDALGLPVEDVGVDCRDWAADSWGERRELISIFFVLFMHTVGRSGLVGQMTKAKIWLVGGGRNWRLSSMSTAEPRDGVEKRALYKARLIKELSQTESHMQFLVNESIPPRNHVSGR